MAATQRTADPFIEAFRAAYDSDDYIPEWPVPADTAQALAVADFYGVDGGCGPDEADGEMDSMVRALCILAKAYRDAAVDGVIDRMRPAVATLDGQLSLIDEGS